MQMSFKVTSEIKGVLTKMAEHEMNERIKMIVFCAYRVTEEILEVFPF